MSIIGVMTHQRTPRQSWLQHHRWARAAGFRAALFYHPFDVTARLVRGWIRRRGSWARTQQRMPRIHHDIGYYRGAAMISKVRHIKRYTGVQFTGYGLGNKWTIHQLLERCPAAKAHLIPTLRLTSRSDALQFVDACAAVIIKPVNGSQGRDIYRISQRMNDRSFSAKPFRFQAGLSHTDYSNAAALLQRSYMIETPHGKVIEHGAPQLMRFLRGLQRREPWLLQQYIDIAGKQGGASDIRVLMQKNGSGVWIVSAIGVRRGHGDGLISNIKAGGSYLQLHSYVAERFDMNQRSATGLESDAITLCNELSQQLEAASGKRLVELGFDLAIDPAAHLWLMEVNIKPGKSILHRLHGRSSYVKGGANPYRYAKYLTSLAHH